MPVNLISQVSERDGERTLYSDVVLCVANIEKQNHSQEEINIGVQYAAQTLQEVDREAKSKSPDWENIDYSKLLTKEYVLEKKNEEQAFKDGEWFANALYKEITDESKNFLPYTPGSLKDTRYAGLYVEQNVNSLNSGNVSSIAIANSLLNNYSGGSFNRTDQPVIELAEKIDALKSNSDLKDYHEYRYKILDALFKLLDGVQINEELEEEFRARGKITEYLKDWTCTTTEGPVSNSYDYLDIDNYFDMYNGMTPYIDIKFRNDKSNGAWTWNEINTIKHPYIKSLNVKDNGIKTITIELVDANYGSYDGTQIPLEVMIKKALNSGKFTTESNMTAEDGYEASNSSDESKQVSNPFTLLKIKEWTDSAANDPTNIIVRFGYADENRAYDGGNRSNRWWDIKKIEGKETGVTSNNLSFERSQYSKADGTPNYNIVRKTASGNLTGNSSYGNSRNNKNREIQINSTQDQSTVMSTEIGCMITGYSTSISDSGITYSITAIESKAGRIMTQRFLQRYANIEGYPEAVLYTLMNIFNATKNSDGSYLNNNDSKIKLWLLKDSEDETFYTAGNFLNQMYDMSEEPSENATTVDTIKFSKLTESDTFRNFKKNNIGYSVGNMKKISVSLGGDNAFKNYYSGEDSKISGPLYKSVKTLLDEFCAACPPKVEYKEPSQKIVDAETGEEITLEKSSVSRPLQWSMFSLKGADNIINILFYYRRPKKINKMRRYVYGPRSSRQTAIKRLQVNNSNEFAILSAVSAFDATKNKTIIRTGDSYISGLVGNKQANIVTDSEKCSTDYQAAYGNSVYEGNIEIIGDPFYSFDDFMLPCCYPIRLDVEIPRSEFTRRSSNTSYDEYFARKNYGSNYLHESSGYYVIKEIEHTISNGEFTTNLKIMSYPNIEEDVTKVK